MPEREPMKPAAQTSSTSPATAGGLAGSDLSGKTLGDFRLLRRLGQGGMGQVYLAEQIALKRKVALKIMRPDLAISSTSFQRFKAEAEAVARVTHAHIVQVYAFGEQDGLHYMALEYVEGRNLADYVAKKGSPDVPLALSIMRQVAAALQRASELGITHRDIKPENILLTRRGEVKVADFGLSRCFAGEQPAPSLTQPGVALGTPLYMSPEQVQGQPVDPRTDIYSFGVTCYYMLTGQPPYRGPSAMAVAVQHVHAAPASLSAVRPDLPAELCAIVHKMMAKAPQQRYQTCNELLKDLGRLREHLASQKTKATATAQRPLAALATSARTALGTLAGLRSWWLGLAGLSVIFALVAGGTLAWMRNRSQAEGAAYPADATGTAELPLSEGKAHEKFLRDAVKEYANPGNDRRRLELGLRHGVELALFYLERHRLADADQFFTDLIKNAYKVEAYKTLGRLGHAVVLAWKDRTAESNREFMDLLGWQRRNGKPPPSLPFLLNQPQLRYEIGRALDRNKANETPEQPFPPTLEYLRDPPRWPRSFSGGPRSGKVEKTPAKQP